MAWPFWGWDNRWLMGRVGFRALGSETGGLVGGASEFTVVNSGGAWSRSFPFDFLVVLLEYLVCDDGETGLGFSGSCDRFGLFRGGRVCRSNG
ncbi:MAG: hypothetical protein HONDAALG_00513 [Gammaproteobacteria bacterium]|nr:hypothetical protein [Gammaproteobacteria bacterium]